MPRRIAFVIGDAGSANYLTTVYPQLLKRGYGIDIFADPQGDALDIASRDYRALIKGREEELKEQLRLFEGDAALEERLADAALVCLGSAGKRRDWWKRGHEKAAACGKPTLWFCDFFYSGCESFMRDYAPHYAAFFDEASVSEFTRKSSRARTLRTIVGNPSFDALHDIDVSQARRIGRNRRGLPDDATYIHYSASSISQVSPLLALGLFAELAKTTGAYVSIGFHPTDLKDLPEEVATYRNAVKRNAKHFVELSTSFAEQACAADLFLTDYSTTGVQATALGVPTAFFLLEDARGYLAERGNPPPYIPLVEDRGGDITPAALGIFEYGTAVSKLTALLGDKEYRRAMQETFRLNFGRLGDGQATHRFLSFIDRVFDP